MQKPLLSKLNKRLISGLVLSPITILALIEGQWLFGALVLAAFVISVSEWIGMARRGSLPRWGFIAGFVYFIISYGAFLVMRMDLEHGLYITVTLMLTVWSSDIAAYITGKMIGGPKMAPVISPKKTWAGLAGAMIGAGLALCILMVLGPFLSSYFLIDLTLPIPALWLGFLLGCTLGMIGQAGDLLISIVKRQVGVKDTGTIIPGHGGLLDRIDALLLACPVFLLMILGLSL